MNPLNLSYPLLIDGGLSNVLEKKGFNLKHQLWSAKVLMEKPEAIRDAHLDYLNCGAKCIITASYQASIAGFRSLGLSTGQAIELLKKSTTLAEQAVNTYLRSHHEGSKPLIASSIGPYGAFLADGSEYHGNYDVSQSELLSFHESKLQVLDTTSADLFACETIPSFREAQVLSQLLANVSKPAWVSFSCRNETDINDGTPLAMCAELFANHPNIFAIGINCTAPKYVSSLIQVLKSASDKKVVVYPNSGEVYQADSKTWSGSADPHDYARKVKNWIEEGADIVGGCCRIGPDHIHEAANFLLK